MQQCYVNSSGAKKNESLPYPSPCPLVCSGYKEDNRGRTSGSRVAFVHSETGHIIRLRRPHPGNILKKYQIEQLIDESKNQGVI